MIIFIIISIYLLRPNENFYLLGGQHKLKKYPAYMWCCVEHPALWLHRCCVTHVFLQLFWAILGRCTSDAVPPKCIILFADVTLLNNAVMSYVMSQCCMCIGHVTIYYKRAANASVGGSCLLFIHLSGLTLSPETHVWLVSYV